MTLSSLRLHEWMNEWIRHYDYDQWPYSSIRNIIRRNSHRIACSRTTSTKCWVPVAMSPSIDRYAFNWWKSISNDKNIEEHIRRWRQSDVIDFKSEKPIQTTNCAACHIWHYRLWPIVRCDGVKRALLRFTRLVWNSPIVSSCIRFNSHKTPNFNSRFIVFNAH